MRLRAHLWTVTLYATGGTARHRLPDGKSPTRPDVGLGTERGGGASPADRPSGLQSVLQAE